jgi:hypothetical protein
MKGLALCALYTLPCVGKTTRAPSLPLTQTRKSCVIAAPPRTATSITSVTYACVCVSSHPALVDGSNRGYAPRTAPTLLNSQPSMTNDDKWISSGYAGPPRRRGSRAFLKNHKRRTASRARIS